MSGFQDLQDALGGISDAQLDGLDELKREISQAGKAGSQKDIDIEAQISIPVPNIPTLALAKRIISGTPARSIGLYVIYSDGRSEEIDGRGLDKAYRGNQDFKDWCDTNLGGKPTLSMIKDYINRNAKAGASGVSDATSKETFSTEKSGFGLKAKNGRIRTKKIGAGVKYEPEPTYRQLGKYVINIQQLKERDILNVKFPSLGRIPQFKPTPISDVLKEFILDLLETGKVSNRIYEQIPIEERQLFERIATGAGILNALKLKRTMSNEDKEDNDRFVLLKGEYLAGNNSVALLKELRKLVVKFMSQGKISKHDGMNLLIELSV
jgi:hypothetical protein